MPLIVATDVGGTFTDVLVMDMQTGKRARAKVLSTPEYFGRGVMNGVREALRAYERTDRVQTFLHSTTVGTNSILEGTGPRVALLTTKGFRDVLEIGRARRPVLYDIGWSKPTPLVPRQYRKEVDERIGANGEPLHPMDEREVNTLLDEIADLDVESIAVCYLHSYLNAEHERATARVAESRPSAPPLSLSCDVCPEMGEFERTSTTVINAYLKPTVGRYVERLLEDLDSIAHGAELHSLIMQSSGGVVPLASAKAFPVRTIESGPAAGVRGAEVFGSIVAEPNLIAFDMGGTTAKACLVENGAAFCATEYQVGSGMNASSRLRGGGGYVVRVPSLDVAEVGFGGGTIAHVDELGVLHLGPRSAGADPGPACYGRGGREPTITDAHVVLGRIPDVARSLDSFDPARARDAIAALAARIGDDNPATTARTIVDLANLQMVAAIRAVTTERGRDPAQYALVAFGGAGPLHAAELAELLGIAKVIVPPRAGLFSAAGLLAAPVHRDVITVVNAPLTSDVLTRVHELRARLERDSGGGDIDRYREGTIACTWELSVHIAGQHHAIAIPFAADATVDGVRQAFLDLYAREFGYLPPAPEIEVAELRGRWELRWSPDMLRRIMLGDAPVARPRAGDRAPSAGHGLRRMQRHELGDGSERGPLVIADDECTIFVPAGWSARVGEGGGLWLTR